MAYDNPNARFKAWILETSGRECVRKGYPYRSEIRELEMLKEMITQWRRAPLHMAIFYDLRRTDDLGNFLEIGRYQNQRFEGI